MCLAIPIQINRILPDEQASGAQLGVQIQFSTAVVENPQIGDYVLVHAGIAIQKLDEADALETLSVWADIQGGEPQNIEFRRRRPLGIGLLTCD